MSREWKPGAVAMVTYPDGNDAVPVLTDRGELAPLWIAGGVRTWARDGEMIARPLVVIDPEDREQVEAHWRMAGQTFPSYRAALREFANPTPPREVFRHYIGSSDGDMKTALCGKVWQPNAANVTVMGDCPTCIEIVKSGWSA